MILYCFEISEYDIIYLVMCLGFPVIVDAKPRWRRMEILKVLQNNNCIAPFNVRRNCCVLDDILHGFPQ